MPYDWRNLDPTTALSAENLEASAAVTLAEAQAYANQVAGIPPTIVNATGDLIVGAGPDVVGRLAVSGTNGRVLTEDATQPMGVKWAAAAGGDVTSQTAATGPGGVAGANSGAAVTIPDPINPTADFGVYWMTLSANCVVTMPTTTPGATFILRWTQSTVGGRSISFAATPTVQIDGAALTQRTGPRANNAVVCIAGTDPATSALTWYVYPLTSADPALTPNSEFVPADHGMITWAYDPSYISGGTVLATAGRMQLTRLHVPVATTVTTICLIVTASGAGLTTGQNFAGLYQGGALLGVTADQTTNTGTNEGWNSTGGKTMAIAGGPVGVAAGDVYVGWWANWATTAPQFGRLSTSSWSNFGIAGTSSRYGRADTGLTATAPTTLGIVSADSNAYWAGLQ